MESSVCCGRRPRQISIELPISLFTIGYCEACETRRWFRDGTPVELADATRAFAKRWNRKQAA
jgi:hypothetical protein